MSFEFGERFPDLTQERIRASARKRRLALNISQKTLAEQSGVPLSTLKRFEQSGEVSLKTLLDIASGLDALEEFGDLFPEPEAMSLDQLETRARQRQRAGRSKG